MCRICLKTDIFFKKVYIGVHSSDICQNVSPLRCVLQPLYVIFIYGGLFRITIYLSEL